MIDGAKPMQVKRVFGAFFPELALGAIDCALRKRYRCAIASRRLQAKRLET
jgi:hypothetical protein